MTRSYSAALPIAHVLLWTLFVLNWLVGAAILALLTVMPHEQWIICAALSCQPGDILEFHPDADAAVQSLAA